MEKTMEEKTGRIEDVVERISEALEKIDKGRYMTGILQQLFAVPPGCQGEIEPKDPVLFALGVETILEEILKESTKASDYLLGLLHSKVLRGEVTS
jgi:hypothetical protein